MTSQSSMEESNVTNVTNDILGKNILLRWCLRITALRLRRAIDLDYNYSKAYFIGCS